LRSFDEENVIAYEFGTKSRLMDGRATFNFSAFFNDYEDFQLESLVGLVPQSLNIGDLESSGIEMEGRVLVTDNFELSGTYGYLDADITSSLDPDILGKDTPQAPKHSASLGAHYYMDLAGGKADFSAIWRYSDNYWFDIFNTLEQPSINLINLRAGFEAASGRWGLAAHGENVTDEEYFAHRFIFLDVANRRANGRHYRVEFSLYF
jgi:iron complex outermembrane receptor protein